MPFHLYRDLFYKNTTESIYHFFITHLIISNSGSTRTNRFYLSDSSFSKIFLRTIFSKHIGEGLTIHKKVFSKRRKVIDVFVMYCLWPSLSSVRKLLELQLLKEVNELRFASYSPTEDQIRDLSQCAGLSRPDP